MLKNMKIKVSMILGYAITIGLSVIFIALTLLMLKGQQVKFDDVIDTYVHANMQARDIRLQCNIVARNIRELALFPGTDEAKRLRTEVTTIENELEGQLKELSALDPLKDNSINAYIDAVKSWMKATDSILSDLDSGRVDSATRKINDVCVPALRQMADYGAKVTEALNAEQERVFRAQYVATRIVIWVTIAVIAAVTVIVVIFARNIIQGIVVPVEQVRAALHGFSEGRLDVPVTYEGGNELGEMCAALRASQSTLLEIIRDECHLLEEMAKGNFDIRSKDANMYVGELSSVITSVRTINSDLSNILGQIRQSAEQVAAGADQVSTGAQSLAQGATEQASAVEELSATIADISNNAHKNADTSKLGMDHARAAGQQVQESARYMEQMVGAMGEISESSEEIKKIIATIENIAFQTNILALNAAVEAARAGAAGKGFAVVADEVRNLASKSDQAAKTTKEKIENSIKAVQDGNDIAANVSESLNKTVDLAEQLLHDVESISNAAKQESESIAQVTEGIDQISSVVQTNSATSEESAAASEELSSQASLMKQLMIHFKLRNDQVGAQQSTYSPTPAVGEDVMDEGESTVSPADLFSKY